jgi:hypothetical protein
LIARYCTDGADFLDGNPNRLLSDLYYLGDFRGFAVYVFFAGSQLFIVDAPGARDFVEFVDARLRQLGREPVAPTAVLLTSFGSPETAGLRKLIEKYHARVVASPAGLESLKALRTAGTLIFSAAELPEKHWFSVSSIPVRGRGRAPMAYPLTCGGKTVIFSGQIPLKINHDSGQKLISDLAGSRTRLRDYFTSLTQLRGLKPDLWLLAIPTDGQNANLYDSDWERAIDENLLIINMIISKSN